MTSPRGGAGGVDQALDLQRGVDVGIACRSRTGASALTSKVWKPVATMIVPTLISLSSSCWVKSIAFFSPQASTQVFLHLPVSTPRLKFRQTSGSISTTWGVAWGKGM